MTESLQSAQGNLFPQISDYVARRGVEFDQIPADRRQALENLAACIRRSHAEGQPAQLTFVCTHNSRRSHFAHVWAQIAAAYYGIDHVRAYSGGTEATAFNPRTVAALKRCGVKFEVVKDSQTNPHYAVSFSNDSPPLIGFSKVFNMPPNPSADYCAVMTCSQADQTCPSASGCRQRIAIPYEDPKISDDTPQETAVYDQRCAQISREMMYVMSRATDR